MAAISIAILLAFPIHGLATIVWEITAGDPDYYMSDAIIVRNSPDENFDVTAENPAGFEWQGSHRRAGALFEAADYDNYGIGFNQKLLVPPETPAWTAAEWDTNLIGSFVVPIR